MISWRMEIAVEARLFGETSLAGEGRATGRGEVASEMREREVRGNLPSVATEREREEVGVGGRSSATSAGRAPGLPGRSLLLVPSRVRGGRTTSPPSLGVFRPSLQTFLFVRAGDGWGGLLLVSPYSHLSCPSPLSTSLTVN